MTAENISRNHSIYKDYLRGTLSFRDIGDKYGRDRRTIWSLCNRYNSTMEANKLRKGGTQMSFTKEQKNLISKFYRKYEKRNK